MQPDAETASYNIGHLAQFRESRFRQSIANNPNFYCAYKAFITPLLLTRADAPFSGVAVTQAAYAFIYRYMANHTAENPAGFLNQEILKSFFAIEGSSDDLTWTRGYERIPDNWYRRADGDVYGLNQLGYDNTMFFEQYPDFSKPGCNQGRVNSYVQINDSDTDPSHYDFSKPNAAICYGLTEVTNTLRGNAVTGIVGGVVSEILVPLKDALGCVSVPSLNKTVEQACPGYSLYGGPTAPVVAGAIQP